MNFPESKGMVYLDEEEEEEEEEIEQGELEAYEQSEQRYEEVQRQPSEPLWRTWDQLAQKSGPHHTVYWAKPCGSTYKGGWDDNRKSGPGIQTWGNGFVYEGEWKDNKPHGSGSLWMKKGEKLILRYRGDFQANKKHGFGVYMFPNGEKYEGEWTAGLRGADPRRPFVSSRCAARVRRRTRGAIPDRALLEGVASRSTRTATSTTESGPKASGPARAFCTKRMVTCTGENGPTT